MLITNLWLSGLMLVATATARVAPDHLKRHALRSDGYTTAPISHTTTSSVTASYTLNNAPYGAPMPVKSHPVYYNSSGPFDGSCRFPTASGVSGYPMPTAGSTGSALPCGYGSGSGSSANGVQADKSASNGNEASAEDSNSKVGNDGGSGSIGGTGNFPAGHGSADSMSKNGNDNGGLLGHDLMEGATKNGGNTGNHGTPGHISPSGDNGSTGSNGVSGMEGSDGDSNANSGLSGSSGSGGISESGSESFSGSVFSNGDGHSSGPHPSSTGNAHESGFGSHSPGSGVSSGSSESSIGSGSGSGKGSGHGNSISNANGNAAGSGAGQGLSGGNHTQSIPSSMSDRPIQSSGASYSLPPSGIYAKGTAASHSHLSSSGFPSATGISSSALSSGNGYPDLQSLTSAAAHTSAPYPYSKSGLPSEGASSFHGHSNLQNPTSIASHMSAPSSYSASSSPSLVVTSGTGAIHSISTGSSAKFEPFNPSPGITYSARVSPSSIGSMPYSFNTAYSKSASPSGGISSRSLLPSGSGYSVSNTPTSLYASSRSGYTTSVGSSSLGSQVYSFSGTGYTKPMPQPSGTGFASSEGTRPTSLLRSGVSTRPSASGTGSNPLYLTSGSLSSQHSASSIESNPIYPTSGSGISSRHSASSSGSSPMYPMSGSGISSRPSASGIRSSPAYPVSGSGISSPIPGTGKVTYPFGSVTSTALRPTMTGSGSVYSSGMVYPTLSGTSYSMPYNATSAYYPTGALSGVVPTATSSYSQPISGASVLSSATSAIPSSILPSVSSVASSVPPVCVGGGARFKLLVSGSRNLPDGSYVKTVATTDVPDYALLFGPLEDGSTFNLVAGGGLLTTQIDGIENLANLNPQASYPAILRFDPVEEFAVRETQQPNCRIQDDVLICDVFEDLKFFSCDEEPRVELYGSDIDGFGTCDQLTLNVVAVDGSAYDADACVNSPSTVSTSLVPSITPPLTSTLASITSAIAPISSACVPSSSTDEFILQVSASDDIGFAGEYVHISGPAPGSTSGSDDDLVLRDSLGDATLFRTVDGALKTGQGNNGVETAILENDASISTLVRFVSSAQLAARGSLPDSDTTSLDCNIVSGTLECTAGSTGPVTQLPVQFYICNDEPEIQATASSLPPDGCNALTFNVLNSDGSPVDSTSGCVGVVASAVTSAIPSVVASVTSALASVSSALPATSSCVSVPPTSLDTFNLQVTLSDSTNYGFAYLTGSQDSENDDIVEFSLDQSDGSSFTLAAGFLKSTDGTSLQPERGSLHPDVDNQVRFDTETQSTALIASGGDYVGLTCDLENGILMCTNDGTPIVFYSCVSYPSLLAGAAVEDDCIAATLTATSLVGTDSCSNLIGGITSALPSVTSAIEASQTSVVASVTSAVASVTSACVSTPLETFILQASTGDFAQVGFSPMYNGGTEDELFLTADSASASTFSLAGLALTSNSGSSGQTETATMHLFESNNLLRFDTAGQINPTVPTGIGGPIIITLSCTIVDNDLSCAGNQFYLCDGVEPIQVGANVPDGCTAVTFTSMSPDGTSGNSCIPAGVATSISASITAIATATSVNTPSTSACVSTPLDSFYLQAIYPGSGVDNYLSLEPGDGTSVDDDIAVPSLGLPAKFTIVGTTLTTFSGTSGMLETAETHVQDNRLYFDTTARNALLTSQGNDPEVFECSVVNGDLSCDDNSVFFICPGLLGVRLGASVPGSCTGVDLHVVPTGDPPGDSCASVTASSPSVTSAIASVTFTVASVTSAVTSVTSACIPAPAAPLETFALLASISGSPDLTYYAQLEAFAPDDAIELVQTLDTASTFTIAPGNRLQTNDGTSGQSETAGIEPLINGHTLRFVTGATTNPLNAATPLTCMVKEDGSISCVNFVFYTCPSISRVQASGYIPAGCTEVTFTTVAPAGTSSGDTCQYM